MKAAINKDGILMIESETELESYALNRWIKDYVSFEDDDDAMLIDSTKIEFDWGFNSNMSI